jgi:GT2 family glycosyltransferase
MDLSIVLVNWNGLALLQECIRTIDASGTRCAYEIIVSDNGSTDGSRAWLEELQRRDQRVRCLFSEDNPGFGVGNNRALPLCQGRYVLFLNTDTLVQEPFDALVEVANGVGARCGVVGGRVLNADRTIQRSCRLAYTLPVVISSFTLGLMGMRPWWVRRQEMDEWDHASARDVAMVTGCYMLVPRHVLDEVGAFDPKLFLYYEETDLCYRIRRAGYVIRYTPVSTIVHLGGASTRSDSGTVNEVAIQHQLASARYFVRRYMGRLHAAILVWTVHLSWRALWCGSALLGATILRPGPRDAMRRRAQKLSYLLTHGA